MSESLVIQSKVKDAVKACAEDFRVSGDFAEALSAHVAKVVHAAVERAKANGRKTVQPFDIG